MICRKCRHLNPPSRLVCHRCKSLVTAVRLKVITGHSESLLSLPLRNFNLGRSTDNDLIIPDDSVSRHHARLHFVDGHCEVEDLHSKNGVFLNGARIQRQRLRQRDCLQIGETRIFLLCDAVTEDPASDEGVNDACAESNLGEQSPAAQSVARMMFALQRLLLQSAIKVVHAREAVLIRCDGTGALQIVAQLDANNSERLLSPPTASAAQAPKRGAATTFGQSGHSHLPAALSSDEQDLARECLERGEMCSMREGRQRLIQTINTSAPGLLRCAALVLPLQQRGFNDGCNSVRGEGAPHLILLRWTRRQQPLSSTRLAALERFGLAAATCWNNAETCLAQWWEGTAALKRHATGKASTSPLAASQTAGTQSPGLNMNQHLPFYELAWWTTPAGPVSGDYFEAIPVNENEAMIVQADISGKSELMTMLLCLLRVGLHLLLPVLGSPLKIAETLNRLLLAAMPNSIFVTMFLAVLDRRHQVLRYVNAGHPPAFAIVPTLGQPELHLLRNNGPALGVLESPDLREEAMPWSASATLLVYTDGIIEARRGNEPQFGLDGLTQTVLSHFRSPHPSSPAKLIDAVRKALPKAGADHSAMESRRDDQTILAIRTTI